jgi:D-3-phosphoglycerate dehydrogenase
MSVVTSPRVASKGARYRVIVLDDLAEKGLSLLSQSTDLEYDIRTGLKGAELKEALAEYDGAVCRSGVKITAEALEGNRKLRAIVRAGVGTDNIDKAAATRLGIIVMNTPDGNTVSTAEHTLAMMLGLSRNLAAAHASLKAGKWDRKSFEGTQLCGKKLGVIGLGRIGFEVAKRALALGMEVLGYDPFMSTEKAAEVGIRKFDTVEQLIPDVDYLTVHTPLTPETKGMIGSDQIALMKRGVRLINCARGGIYDEQALVEGLQSGQLGGVALDVFSEEPCTDNPLFQLPNTLCTPHLGASTEEAQIEVAVEAVDLLVNYLVKGEIRSAVNTVSLDSPTLQKMRGYLDVAYRLGMLLGQWHAGNIDACELKIAGEIAGKNTRILVSAFCAGLIGDKIEGANFVNAELLCRERGIDVRQQTTLENTVFSNVIGACVIGDGRKIEAAGTLFGKNMPRLIRLNDYITDAYMDGNLLIFTHTDAPGVIAHVSRILADNRINVAQMAVARAGNPGGAAIGVLNLDSPAEGSVLDLVHQYHGIDSVKQVHLPHWGDYPDWMA